MRIAQVAPLYEAVPPRLYGGTERVVAHLTDALVDLGHQVTLFASAEAQTKAPRVFLRSGSAKTCDGFTIAASATGSRRAALVATNTFSAPTTSATRETASSNMLMSARVRCRSCFGRPALESGQKRSPPRAPSTHRQ